MALLEADDATASDDALVAAASRGDERAFENLYRRYRADIRAFCSRSLSDPHITEDVTQETFLRAFRHIGDFERGRPLWPWLVTIARRLCIDELRGTNRRAALGHHPVHASDDVYDATSEEALARVERQRLNRVISVALGALRPRDRKVFVLQSIQGWTHEEIAEQHGMSVHAVRNLAWRARRTLRRSLRSERSWGWLLAFRARPHRKGPAVPWRWRLRSWMDARLEAAAVDRAAVVVLGLATAGVTFFGGGAMPSRVPGATVFRSVRTVSIREPVTVSDPSPRVDRQGHAHRSGPPPSIVGASVSFAGEHEGAAAPSGAKVRVDVTTPDGRTLASYEHNANCVEQGSTLLPQAGPVTAVC